MAEFGGYASKEEWVEAVVDFLSPRHLYTPNPLYVEALRRGRRRRLLAFTGCACGVASLFALVIRG